MQLADGVWLAGPFYIDFDALGQLRIAGPGNHLFFGSAGLYKKDLQIDQVETVDGQAVIEGYIKAKSFLWHDPALGHIRKVRRLVELPHKTKPTFLKVFKEDPDALAPNFIGAEQEAGGHEISYRRVFQDHWYGVRLILPQTVRVKRKDRQRGFKLILNKGEMIPFKLVTDADHLPRPELSQVVLTDDLADIVKARPELAPIIRRASAEAEYLVKYDKTSGFEYGTVFPRDWVESADLGTHNLTPEAVRYMHHKALEFVDPAGEAWHENIIGEFAYERRQEAEELEGTMDDLLSRSSKLTTAMRTIIGQLEATYVSRHMIDVEPRYLLGLFSYDPKDLNRKDLERLARVARLVLEQARSNQLITFKRLSPLYKRHKHDEYHQVGNWRDSRTAYLGAEPPIAPFDVNAVFYPQALVQIKRYAKVLQVEAPDIDELIAKWLEVKKWYKFKNLDGQTAYALALYGVSDARDGIQFKQLKVNHLDESYDLFFGTPSEADVASFSKRLIDPYYFFTPSGPTLVGQRDGYSTTGYHGTVIWTKQTAFTVAGLRRQKERSRAEGWSQPTQALIDQSLRQTSHAALDAFIKLEGFPELHYDLKGQPHFYSDQPKAEGPMNKVQLWSAVGALRIIRDSLL